MSSFIQNFRVKRKTKEESESVPLRELVLQEEMHNREIQPMENFDKMKKVFGKA